MNWRIWEKGAKEEPVVEGAVDPLAGFAPVEVIRVPVSRSEETPMVEPPLPPPPPAPPAVEPMAPSVSVTASEPPVSHRVDWVVTEESEPGKDVRVDILGAAGYRHHITTISASLNQPHAVYLTLLFAGRKRMQWYVHSSLNLVLPHPIVAGPGESLLLYLHLQSPRQRASEDLAGYISLAGFTDV